jgi:hypothetical protein
MDAVRSLRELHAAVDRTLGAGPWKSASHADAEALAFMQLVMGDVAAIELLGETNIHFVIAGTAAARAAYETVVTCAWMLTPDSSGERDRRWMALFKDEYAYWTRMVEEAVTRKDQEPIVQDLKAEVSRVEQIISNVGPQLQALGLAPMQRMPALDERLQEVGQERNYVLYKTACQYVHPTTRALATVRDLYPAHSDEVRDVTYQWRMTARDWTTALLLGAESLAFGLETLGSRLQPAQKLTTEVVELFNAVASRVRAMA